MKNVGQILKEARKRQDITLEEAEKGTKIRKKILLLLESGTWNSLPSTTFVQGLLKNYGKFLGLDTQSLLAFFRREYEEPKIQKNLLSEEARRPKLRFTPQILTILFLVLAFAGSAFYLFLQYKSFTGAPMLEVTDPPNNIKVENLDVNVVGKTYSDSVLKINGQPVQLTTGGTFAVAVSLVEGINSIVVTSENRFGKISTEKRTVVVETKNLGTDVSETPKRGLTLSMKIGPGSAQVKIEEDGKKAFEGVLVAGSLKEFSAKERVKIFTSNAGSTKVIFEGKEQALGKEGEKIEKEFKSGS